ncbi:MAG: hypothetical protein HPY44_11120 [Armatimonadetes bacterium]|nr:hypothetical protein [Armatimonadota bacterium]
MIGFALTVGLIAVLLATAAQAQDGPAETLAEAILDRLGAQGLWPSCPATTDGAVPASDYAHLVIRGEWNERWPDGAGGMKTVAVRGELWSAAIQAALDAHAKVLIPARPEPYYLDAPLVLKFGQTLIADPEAELRLKPGTNTCLVRNANPVSGWPGPVPETSPDTDITIQGGIWTDLATAPAESNGNGRGSVDRANSVPGAYGIIVLTNVARVVVRDLVVRQSRPFGVHLTNARDFLVENLRFEDHRRDGVHVNGPASYGLVRGISGVTGDDMVALNAWDWQASTMTFGRIHHVLVEDVTGRELSAESSGPVPDGSAEIRLLPGYKRFPDGAKLACPIEDVLIRRIRSIRTLKMYDQPNLEMGRDLDFSQPIGEMRGIFVRDAVTVPTHEALAQVHSNVDGLDIANVVLQASALPDGYALVSVGPLSAVYKHNPADPATWVEIFSPDKDCTVRNLSLSRISLQPPDGERQALDADALIRVIEQKPNPDYPRSQPKGGTGRGHLVQ